MGLLVLSNRCTVTQHALVAPHSHTSTKPPWPWTLVNPARQPDATVLSTHDIPDGHRTADDTELASYTSRTRGARNGNWVKAVWILLYSLDGCGYKLGPYGITTMVRDFGSHHCQNGSSHFGVEVQNAILTEHSNRESTPLPNIHIGNIHIDTILPSLPQLPQLLPSLPQLQTYHVQTRF